MKLSRAVAVVAVAVVIAKIVGFKKGDLSWETIFEKLPDDAPPKWLFNNISAIREQNDRIIELLQDKPAEG